MYIYILYIRSYICTCIYMYTFVGLYKCIINMYVFVHVYTCLCKYTVYIYVHM